ncbi:MAG TPA: hypothetical protein VK828_17430 [Terriglobales bacterium]|jgi:hypothetical protein|nr:hypothetical protein [Terriglobales bacterium]
MSRKCSEHPTSAPLDRFPADLLFRQQPDDEEEEQDEDDDKDDRDDDDEETDDGYSE